jgi:molecular chaperone DnaJ
MNYICSKAMVIKDYYKTLQVPPTATEMSIKKSFRRLALLYHPDKNQDNAIAEAFFKEIQEAYEVLMDPKQREEYNYKRWYNRSIGKDFFEKAITPVAILEECKKLNNYLSSVNRFHVDYLSLNHHIQGILSDESIVLLKHSRDQQANRNIVSLLLHCSNLLPWRYAGAIAEKLVLAAGGDEIANKKIIEFLKQQKRQHRWKKVQGPLMVALTLLLCWIIFHLSK